MTGSELKKAIRSAAKTLNSRIRRLKNENLPSSTNQRIQDAQKYNSPLVTSSGYASGSTAGLTLKQLESKLKWIRGITSETETVAQSRALVEKRAKEWGVKKEEASRRIQAGRVFYQVLGRQGYKWDSTEIHNAIQEFDSTPTYDELENKLFEKYGADMQGTEDGSDTLREWMNEHNEIPPGVYAHHETNPRTGQDEIIFDDEFFDENGDLQDGGYRDENGEIIYI